MHFIIIICRKKNSTIISSSQYLHSFQKMVIYYPWMAGAMWRDHQNIKSEGFRESLQKKFEDRSYPTKSKGGFRFFVGPGIGVF